MSNDSKLVTYSQKTRQLSAVPDGFAAQNMSVLSIVWKSGIDAGADISPGTELADIQWEDNSRSSIAAPDGCSGQIASVNRHIMFENLAFEPSQWLLILQRD